MNACVYVLLIFFFSSRRRHTRWNCDWSSDVCSSDLKLGFGSAAPLDGEAGFGLVHEVLNVGTRSCVHGDTATAGDVADNFVARNGIATLGAVNEQVVVALNHEWRLAKTEHAFDGLDESGFGIDGLGLGRFFRFSENAGEDLAGGIFSETDGGKEILNFGKTAVGNEFEEIGFGYFLEAAAEMTGFVFEQPLAHFRGFFTFLFVDPMADLALRRGRPNKTEPIATGVVALLRENLNHVAASDFMAKRHHLAIHLCADALVPHFGVDHVGKIDRGSPAREFQHTALRGKRVNLHRREVHS